MVKSSVLILLTLTLSIAGCGNQNITKHVENHKTLSLNEESNVHQIPKPIDSQNSSEKTYLNPSILNQVSQDCVDPYVIGFMDQHGNKTYIHKNKNSNAEVEIEEWFCSEEYAEASGYHAYP
jgi:hypothetical protein